MAKHETELVVWEDSFVSSSRFADLQLNAIEHWLVGRRSLRRNRRRQARAEIKLEEAGRDAAFIDCPTNGLRRRRRECTADTIRERVAQLGKLALWRRRGPGGGPVAGQGWRIYLVGGSTCKVAVLCGPARMCIY